MPLDDPKCVVVYGPRQSGKRSLSLHIGKMFLKHLSELKDQRGHKVQIRWRGKKEAHLDHRVENKDGLMNLQKALTLIDEEESGKSKHQQDFIWDLPLAQQLNLNHLIINIVSSENRTLDILHVFSSSQRPSKGGFRIPEDDWSCKILRNSLKHADVVHVFEPILSRIYHTEEYLQKLTMK